MTKNAYGAGIRHAEITDALGATFDVEAVINHEGAMSLESQEIKGDDTVKATFYSSQKAEITLEANSLNLDVLEAITGTTVEEVAEVTSVSMAATEFAVGTTNETNPPFVQTKSQQRAKAKDGSIVTIEVTYHKVQLRVPDIAAALESEFSQSIKGIAYKTSADIEGNALSNSRIATVRIVAGDSTPA